MSSKERLLESFFPGAGRPAEESGEIEDLLEEIFRAGQAAWPAVGLSAQDFARHLGRHLPEGQDAAGFLSSVNGSDLFLANACAQGLPAALSAFDRAFLSQVPAFVARIDPSPDFADEVRQVLRERLLVAAGAEPKIAEYAGGGALVSWLRVAATRTALNLRRGREVAGAAPSDQVDAATLEGVASGPDPELGYVKARYQQEFKAALQEAFAGLPREQRNVLRLHFAGGLTGDKIAALLRVHRATVVRWLGSAREALLRETRRLLRDRLRVTPAELDSLTEVLRSQLDLSLTALFRTAGET